MAIALLTVPRAGLESTALPVVAIGGGSCVSTFVYYDGEDRATAAAVRQTIGAAMDAHSDPRGVFVHSEHGEPGMPQYKTIIGQMTRQGHGRWLPNLTAAEHGELADRARELVMPMLALRRAYEAAVARNDRAAAAAANEAMVDLQLEGSSEEERAQHRQMLKNVEESAIRMLVEAGFTADDLHAPNALRAAYEFGKANAPAKPRRSRAKSPKR
jgi:hypothetical protein